MNQVEVRQYLERYFDAHQANYVEKKPDYFSVQLPIEVDKDLGNRPFYWTYVERLNLEPQPMFMNFIFHPEKTPKDFEGKKSPLVPLAFCSFLRLPVATANTFVCMNIWIREIPIKATTLSFPG